ncbi:MAG: glycoside hydrolase family 18 protein [Janthinobacterium lividum]
MSHFRSLLAAALLLFAIASPDAQTVHGKPAAARVNEPATQIVGYFPQWGIYERRYVPLDLIRSGAMQTLTQIDYAQGNIKDNACVVADPQADLNIAFKAEDSIDGVADAPDTLLRGNFHQLQLLRKRYPKLRILISLEGKRGLFEEAAKPENRVAFVHSCVARFLQGHIAPGVEVPHLFDGIDVDWEYPDEKHADDFYGLMEEFRRQMDRPDVQEPGPTRSTARQPRYTLSIASGASHKNIDPIHWARVAQSVDQIGVMTYDFQGPWSHDTGFVAPLRSNDPEAETVASVIDAYLAAGVPARQLLLGVPFYAYQWHHVAPGAQNGLYSRGDPVRGNLNQSTASALLAASTDARLYRDPVSQAPWIYDGDNFLTFEDPTSLQSKQKFAQQRQLGGIMIWELSGDTADSQLLHALRSPHTR